MDGNFSRFLKAQADKINDFFSEAGYWSLNIDGVQILVVYE